MGNFMFARSLGTSPIDTLKGKTIEYLQNRFESSLYDNSKAKIYAAAWLWKAKKNEVNYHQIVMAYRANAIISEKQAKLVYADSMISAAQLSKDDELIGTSYMSKGAVHYSQLNHLKALDNYLIADTYISKLGNEDLSHKLKYCIAQIKYYLGFYHEATALLKECIQYYEYENDRAYLSSLHVLGLCHTRVGEFKKASLINQLGISHGKSSGDNQMQSYFVHSEGINKFYNGNLHEAIKQLNTAVQQIAPLKDYANEAVAYFYIGQSYWSLKKYNLALTYFKKVDQIFQSKKYMLPDLRKGYENLIEYYKNKNDTRLQLFYINQLLKVDRLLANDYKHLLTKVVKEYDTKELIKEKESIQNNMVYTRIVACTIVVIMAVVIGYLNFRNRRNKKLFDELMNRDTSHTPVNDNDASEIEIDVTEEQDSESVNKPVHDISPDIETAILKKLEKFESNKKYLESDLNLAKMATILHTNSKYVTKVVARHRGKGTIEYITELKLDYVIQMLKTDSRFRNYTNKALGEDAGFRTTQNFTRAFKSYTGISPTYFIYKLKKSINSDTSS